MRGKLLAGYFGGYFESRPSSRLARHNVNKYQLTLGSVASTQKRVNIGVGGSRPSRRMRRLVAAHYS
ncbi:hypothetical protein E2C01_072031 [Portunus trituberculatus]|uniref:Uncharacterized protein n=1 Tax=Portunus trituberculatus TaxID=210409 RepID=A0A5B7IA08_PORTR|nr:hypothetical protein [Portunus trituberculatus]